VLHTNPLLAPVSGNGSASLCPCLAYNEDTLTFTHIILAIRNICSIKTMKYNSHRLKKIISDHIPDQRSGAAGGPVLSSDSLYSTQIFFFWKACQMKNTLAILAERCHLIQVQVTFYS
jgi:hypothetical protein